jgi:hypothetical protein
MIDEASVGIDLTVAFGCQGGVFPRAISSCSLLLASSPDSIPCSTYELGMIEDPESRTSPEFAYDSLWLLHPCDKEYFSNALI